MRTNINTVVKKFKELSDLHPNINSFGFGELDDLVQDVQFYPYCWILGDLTHRIGYTDDNKYNSIEYAFTIRIGDKVNMQTGYEGIAGAGKDNTLDIISNTFNYVLDFVNSISENSLNMFDNIRTIDDVIVEPFYNQDNGNVCGCQADIILRVANDNKCITQFNYSV